MAVSFFIDFGKVLINEDGIKPLKKIGKKKSVFWEVVLQHVNCWVCIGFHL